MLATQLMNPTAAAAADLVRNADGKDQNDGREAIVPNAIRLNTTTSNAFECGRINQVPSATAAVNCGIAKCHRRSPVRSELQPNTSIPIRPAPNTTTPIQLTWRTVHPLNR